MTKIYLVDLSCDAELLCKKMMIKDQATLEIFKLKELSNLIGREDFGANT